MKRIILLLFTSLFIVTCHYSQVNGKIDGLNDLYTKQTIQFTMPDQVHLSTDIFLPITNDSMLINIRETILGIPIDTSIQIIPRGIQYLIYDSVNGGINPNPYRLPLMLIRTPYNKSSSSEYGGVVSILGLSFAMQDVRGCYESEGVYFPMYSDSWNKNPYHPEFCHLLDITDLSDINNSNKHEDGYNSINFIVDSLIRIYDYNNDGILDTFLLCNGDVGMFGASALANNQYTAAAAHRVNPHDKGLKSLFPIVGSADQYWVTLVQNGVYRKSIVDGWIFSQLDRINSVDEFNTDNSTTNSIHTFSDYGLENLTETFNTCINTMLDSSNNGSLPGYYPNSKFRYTMDASFANVDENGESSINGQYSRLSNIDVPAYHITGWWDIFIDGQIDTHRKIIDNIPEENGNKKMQKLIIGPWAHQTICKPTTGDITYPNNSTSLVGLDVSNIDNLSSDYSSIFSSEIYKWIRATYNEKQNYKAPKFIIPESKTWQPLNDTIKIRIPSRNYIIPYNEFIAFASGHQGLNNLPIEIDFGNGIPLSISYNLPILNEPILSLETVPNTDNSLAYFENIANVRLYIPGPISDGVPENINCGNYWFETDSFPFKQNITYTDFFLHNNHSLSSLETEANEGSLSFTHNPDNPVLTCGGANMLVKTPDGNRYSQGQMNLAAPDVIDLTMNNEGVLSFVSQEITDSLCIIGIPKATLFTSTHVANWNRQPVNPDFFVRILDVYPTGEEYFVVEGCINSRAREYVRSVFNDNENINAEFSNILTDEIYQYQFNLLPIAYTFGKNHKIKILISGGNYPRYMSSSNLPLNDNEFFRRYPNDGKKYTFNGTEMSPVICTNNLMLQANMSSKISLPVYSNIINNNFFSTNQNKTEIDIFPNPCNDKLTLRLNNETISNIKIYNVDGRLIKQMNKCGLTSIDISDLKSGIYIISILDNNTQFVKKIIKKM